MTRFAPISLNISLFVGLAASLAVAESHVTSPWKLDFAAAQAEAKQLNRPLIVHFYGKTCPPCRKMENEVLNKPQVLKLLENGCVAVKVCIDSPANNSLRTKYSITLVPTDLILGLDGKVLSRTTAYVPLDQYLATLGRWEAKFASERKAAAGSSAAAVAKSAPEKAAPEKTTAENNAPAARPLPVIKPEQAVASTGNKLVPPPSEPKKISEAALAPSQPAPPAEPARELPSAIELDQPLLALDGYCPVTLRSTRTWKTGSKDFSFVHDGQTFYFTAATARDEFKANPGRFAPRLLGCDPVALAESDLAVRGSVKFGAYFEGELFLFENADSRAKFRKDPTRYARAQHVLKLEDVKRIAAKE